VSPVVHIKLDTDVHTKSHRFSLLLSNLLAIIHCSLRLTTSHSTMSGEAEQTSNIIGDIPTADSQSAVKVGSKAASSTSSSSMAN
jgi:hypothetical protein